MHGGCDWMFITSGREPVEGWGGQTQLLNEAGKYTTTEPDELS
jgi:hypothetical protein